MGIHFSQFKCFDIIKLFVNTRQIRSYRINRRAGLCDVFINHRGVDTKRNIAALLYDRFVQLELRPFFDCKSMRPGVEIFNHVETAIRDCKVGLVIFSPNYCSSYSCLHELALMTEYQKKIIPIFYNVNPSDIVLVDNGKYPAKELHRFRLALQHAKRRMGFPFDSSNGDWSDLLKRASDGVVEILMELDAEGRESIETELNLLVLPRILDM